jgi:hypothetical protein
VLVAVWLRTSGDACRGGHGREATGVKLRDCQDLVRVETAVVQRFKGRGSIAHMCCGVGGRARALSVDQTVGTGQGVQASVHHAVGGRADLAASQAGAVVSVNGRRWRWWTGCQTGGGGLGAAASAHQTASGGGGPGALAHLP